MTAGRFRLLVERLRGDARVLLDSRGTEWGRDDSAQFRRHGGLRVGMGQIVVGGGAAETGNDRERMMDTEERLRLAVEAAQVGIWDCMDGVQQIRWDARCRALFGLDPEVPVSYRTFLERIHHEDRGRVDAVVQRALLHHATTVDRDYYAEFRTAADFGGETRWLAAHGKVISPPGRSHGPRFIGTLVDITGRKRAEEERERLLADLQAREHAAQVYARREAVSAEIGRAIRAALCPNAVRQTAARALGQALHADRCFFVTTNVPSGTVAVGPEWYSERVPSLQPIAGSYEIQAADGRRCTAADLFPQGQTLCLPCTRTAGQMETCGTAAITSLLDWLGLRSLMAVPLFSGGALTEVLVVAMTADRRDWAVEECTLAEAVATEARAAAEAARNQERERNIAQQLQLALLPPPAVAAPGLALRGYYRAALDEANVGGDFYAVFPVGDGCTALVVGDLSGKGLAAASQVATVQNMLRFALYREGRVADAVGAVSRILSEQELLTGFATLFAGAFDAHSCTLTYANCGQEPGLIFRSATGTIEPLPPTGPVLGLHMEAGSSADPGAFGEVQVAMAPGDVFMIFTDGLTEVGPNRHALLGLDGLTGFFHSSCTSEACRSGQASQRVSAILESLMGQVDGAARDGIRDDTCVLVGLVEASVSPPQR